MFKFKYMIAGFYTLILIAISLSILFISTYLFEELVVRNTTKQIHEQLISSTDLLEMKLDAVYGLAWGISQDSNMQPLLFDNELTSIEQAENSRKAQDIIINYSNTIDFIKSINIFSHYIDIDRPDTNIFMDSLSISYGVYKYEDYRQSIESDVRYQYKKRTYLRLQDNISDAAGIIFLSSITNIKQKETVLGILIDRKKLFNHFNSTEDSFYGNTVILSRDDLIIYKPDGFLMALDFLDYDNLANGFSGDDNDTHIITYRKFDNLDWYAVNITSRDEILAVSKSTKQMTIMICLLLLTISVIGGLVLSSYIVKPLSDIVTKLKTLQNGDLTLSTSKSHIVEIHDLYENFDLMVERIRSLINDVSESQEIQNEYAFQALQAQINPHLLSNTLDAVYWMSDNKEICHIIHNLASFYRLSLSSGQEIVSVADELDHIRAYINIMQIRFKNKFDYTEYIDEMTTLYDTPKLILQPIVENAIHHGFKHMKSGGRLSLSVLTAGNDLHFIIKDNGTGIDEAYMSELLDGQKKTKSYGIRNIHERIQLKYGKDHGLTYRNHTEGGTIVKVNIPLMKRGAL